jgi:hypothetical protein
MGIRLNLQSLLETLVADVEGQVYFQPPPNITMSYPAIVYNRYNRDTAFADNAPYRGTTQWQVTVIDRDPDSAIPDKVASLPRTRFVRHFTTEGLNHDIYYVFY